MKTLEKAVRIAHSQGKTWKQELYRFLLDYRTTPHTTTGVAPADLLFNRTVRNKLPDASTLTLARQSDTSNTGELPRASVASGFQQNGLRDAALQRDHVKKECMKRNADKRNRAVESKLRIGDLVLLKKKQKNKLHLPWDPSPYRVSSLKGSRVTAQRRGVQVTRNSSYFKRIVPYLKDVDDPYFASSEEEEKENYNDREEYDFSDEEDDNQEPEEPEQQRRYPVRRNRAVRPQYYSEGTR